MDVSSGFVLFETAALNLCSGRAEISVSWLGILIPFMGLYLTNEANTQASYTVYFNSKFRTAIKEEENMIL